MLFVQSLNTYYEKHERSSEYARLRTADLFWKIDCDEDVEWCPTKHYGHNEAFNNEKSIFYHKNCLNETAFILHKNQYGRIIFNNRYVNPDSQQWYYGWHIYNIINCDISECSEKMFFEKHPDHEYKKLLDLK